MTGAYILIGLGLIVYTVCFTVGAYFIYELATTITLTIRDILFRWSDNKLKRKQLKYENKNTENK